MRAPCVSVCTFTPVYSLFQDTIFTHTHTYTRAHTYTRIRTHACIHTHTHTHAYTHVHTHSACIHTRMHTHTRAHAYTHTHIHTHACMHTHAYIHTDSPGQPRQKMAAAHHHVGAVVDANRSVRWLLRWLRVCINMAVVNLYNYIDHFYWMITR